MAYIPLNQIVDALEELQHGHKQLLLPDAQRLVPSPVYAETPLSRAM